MNFIKNSNSIMLYSQDLHFIKADCMSLLPRIEIQQQRREQGHVYTSFYCLFGNSLFVDEKLGQRPHALIVI